jgi:hypothetical protein
MFILSKITSSKLQFCEGCILRKGSSGEIENRERETKGEGSSQRGCILRKDSRRRDREERERRKGKGAVGEVAF